MKLSVKLFWIFAISILMITPAHAVRQIHPQSSTPVIGPPVTGPAATVEKKRTFYRWKSSDVISLFKNHGLEVMDIQPGMVVGSPGATENIVFLMPSLGKDVGGLVSSFDLLKSLNNSAKHYSKINDNAASPIWWILKKGNVLVLISRKVPGERVRQYKEALKNIEATNTFN